MKLYRGLDQDELTTQYNVTAAIENVPEIFERFVVESRSFRKRNIGHLNVAYADSPTSVCDIFSKQSGGPVHLFLHGGYWRMFAKDEWSFVAEGMAAAGNNVTCVDLSGHDHLSLLWTLSESKGQLCSAACRQMGLTI